MELAEGLQKYYDITFLHTNQYAGKVLLTNKAIKNKLKGVNIDYRMKYATLKLLNRLFSFPLPLEILKLYKKVRKNDVIYSSYSNIKETLMFLFFSLLHRKGKFIFGYRKPLRINKTSLYNLKYTFSILILSLFKKRIYHHALSKNAKHYLDRFLKKENVYYITHGIDLNSFIEKKEKKNFQTLKFMYIGYFDGVHKGFDVLLKGIKLFLEKNENLKVSFEFCGMGPLEHDLLALEKRFPRIIKNYGYISNELISDYYKKGDVFLFSSRIEPFPRTIMEALGAKMVIISSKTIGSIELLKGKEFAYFLKELTPEEISNAIFRVYKLWSSNVEKFYKLQNAAKSFVFSSYSTEIEIEMFKDMIEKIMTINKL
ncbi:MAG: glycosyltransferase family 4 protein [Promethearchaeota archaeon]